MKKSLLIASLLLLITNGVISQTTTFEWGKKLNISAVKMVTDNAGNIYATGNIEDSANVAMDNQPKQMLYGVHGQLSTYLAKYSSDGTYIWGKVLSGSSDVYASTLSISPNGQTIAVSGSYRGTITGNDSVPNRESNGSNDAYLARFDNSGELKGLSSAGGAGTDYSVGTCYDSEGHLYFAIYLYVNNLHNVNIVKYDKVIGQPVKWQYNIQSPNTISITGIGVDKNGNVFFLARHDREIVYINASGSPAYAQTASSFYYTTSIFKLTSTGTFSSFKQIKENQVNIDGSGLTVSPDGDVYAAGAFIYRYGNIYIGSGDGDTISSLNATNSFLVKYNSNLEFQWVRQIASNKNNSIMQIAMDKQNNVYVAAQINGEVNIAAHNGTYTIGDSGFYKTCVIKYNVNGNVMWAHQYDITSHYIYINSIFFNSIHDVFLTGYSNGNEIDVNPGDAEQIIVGSNSFTAFLNKHSQSFGASVPTFKSAVSNEVKIFPNPANSMLNIQSKDNINTIEICDLNGRIIKTIHCNEKSVGVDVQNFSRGLFLVRVHTENSIENHKVIVN